MSDDKININLLIADRTYPLKIDPAEEAEVRQAAIIVNEKVKEFQAIYEAKDKQDFLAMTALMFAVQSLKQPEAKSTDDPSILEKLSYLNARIDNILND